MAKVKAQQETAEFQAGTLGRVLQPSILGAMRPALSSSGSGGELGRALLSHQSGVTPA